MLQSRGLRPGPPDQTAPTILLVDDDALNQAIARDHLEAAGYRSYCVDSGEQALAFLKQTPVDLVLLDITMPRLDGFETLKAIRRLKNQPDVPVVFFTSMNDLDTHRRAMEAGVDDFLTKPVKQTEMLIRVRSLIRLRELRDRDRSNADLILAQRDELKRSEQRRRELIKLVVHDLKSPLSSVISNLEYIRRTQRIPDDAAEAVHDGLDCANTMFDMILNILDINKSEDGKLVPKLQSTDLPELIRGLQRTLRRRLNARKQSIEVDDQSKNSDVLADPELVRRLLENLLDNGIRHSPDGEAISVDIVRTNDGFVECRVRDLGPGVPLQWRDKIFDQYLQLESGERFNDRTTLGLGLAFCRLATQVHGGRIWVEDNKPRGSSFCIRLPVAGPPDAGSVKPSL
jgi:two-component system sensor histidine kinase/response regulator